MTQPRNRVLEILIELNNNRSKNSVAKKFNTSIAGIDYVIKNKDKFIKKIFYKKYKFNHEQLEHIENIILPKLFKLYLIDNSILISNLSSLKNSLLKETDLFNSSEIDFLLDKLVINNVIRNHIRYTASNIIKKFY